MVCNGVREGEKPIAEKEGASICCGKSKIVFANSN